jgi:hypothetical protein
MEDKPPKEGHLESCVQRIAAAEDLPTFAHHITELMATAGDEDATLRRLANLILNREGPTNRQLGLFQPGRTIHPERLACSDLARMGRCSPSGRGHVDV